MAGPGPVVAGADILREEKLDVGVGYSEVQVKVGCVLVTADIQQAGDTVGGSYNRLLVDGHRGTSIYRANVIWFILQPQASK